MPDLATAPQPHDRDAIYDEDGPFNPWFMREAVRTLNLSTEVWTNRVEAMPPSRQFHTVALRAVDNMTSAIAAAAPRAAQQLLLLAGIAPTLPVEFSSKLLISMPNSETSSLFLATRA